MSVKTGPCLILRIVEFIVQKNMIIGVLLVDKGSVGCQTLQKE
jgi:hypothetical protein